MPNKQLNMIEIAEQYARGEISHRDDRVKAIEEVIAEMASTEDGRSEIAEVIAIYIDEVFPRFDIAPLICKYKNFKLGDRPEFRLKRKGITAYWIAPNSSTPKSRNYQETLSMEFDSLSVRPEVLIDELKAGRVDTFAELIKDSREALRDLIIGRVFTILGQAYNATSNSEFFIADTTSLSQTSLNKAIDTVFYKTGKRPVVLGDMLLTNQIRDFDNFDDDAKKEIRLNGMIGTYRGATILSLPEVKTPTGEILVPKNRLYVVSQEIGYAGTYGDAKSGQETSIEDWTWNARIDKEWGMCITEADKGGLFVIEVQ